MTASPYGQPPRPTPPAAPRRAQLGWCGLLVVCVHVAVLATPASTIGGGGHPNPAPAAAMQLRTIRAATSDAYRQVAAAPAGEVEHRQQGAALRASHAPKPARASNEPEPSPPVRSSESSVTPGDDLWPARLPSAGSDAEYLPRSALSVAPRAVGQINVDYPRFDGEADQYTGEFDVFIDDNGAVVRVASATPDLPGILANAVREAFLAARFSPGEVEGRPVRSRMRIEVTFDSRRLPSS